jgi:galactokinase
VSFVVVNSMISRDAGSVLNERKGECLQALQILQEIGWDISALSAISIADLANVTESLDEKLSRRVRHIVKENQRVRDGIALLQQNHIEEFGKLMIESHESSRDLYEVSHPNLEILMDISQGCEGMFGCRLTGAGSGGNLLLLTKTNDAERIIRETTTEYEKETGLLAESTLCAVPGGVVVEELPEF